MRARNQIIYLKAARLPSIEEVHRAARLSARYYALTFLQPLLHQSRGLPKPELSKADLKFIAECNRGLLARSLEIQGRHADDLETESADTGNGIAVDLPALVSEV
jgi:hypothetical protein